MKKKSNSPHAIKCSFCGRGQDEVAKLVSGPSVYICNECIRLCSDILEEEMAGTMLFDMDADPAQEHPLDEPVVEERMIGYMKRLMKENDAPPEQFERMRLG